MIKDTKTQTELEKSLLDNEGRISMDIVVNLEGRLMEKSGDECNKILAFFSSLVNGQVYMSIVVTIAAVVQIILAAVLGRSCRSVRPELTVGEGFFHGKEKK